MKERIQTHDVDGNGIISMEELLQIMEKEGKLQRERALLRKIVVALSIACLLVIAAVVGLTYAVVHLAKDTSVQSDIFVSKGTNQPLSTGTTTVTYPLADWYKVQSLEKLNGMTTITVPYGDGIGMFNIKNIQLVPEKSIVFDTTTENVTIKVTESGIEVSGDKSSNSTSGRRLLGQEDRGSVTGVATNDQIVTSLPGETPFQLQKLGDGQPCAENAGCVSGACGVLKVSSTRADYECCKTGILTGLSNRGTAFCKGQTELGQECLVDAMCKTGVCQGALLGTSSGVCAELELSTVPGISPGISPSPTPDIIDTIPSGEGADGVQTLKKEGEFCWGDSECQNNACGRATAVDGASLVCCPSGETVFHAGFDYCTQMPVNSVCWLDSMCAASASNCKGNYLGLVKGVCTMAQ
eukprot:jgi/Picsp_1/4089/NSC_01599-R1_predicted protein [Chlamydomonas reinhardtii]